MIQAMASLVGQMASIAGSVQAGQAHLLRLNAQIGQQQQQQQLQLPGYPMSPFGGLSFGSSFPTNFLVPTANPDSAFTAAVAAD